MIYASKSPLAVLAILAACSGAACRQKAPDEKVYTGRPSRDASLPPRDVGAADTSELDASLPDAWAPIEDGGEVEFTKRALLEAVAGCALDHHRAFAILAADLAATAEVLAREPSSAHLAAARRSWIAAMAAWQEAEMFGFGPAARSSMPGGRGLRDQIYSWPLLSRCKIDEQIVSEAYARPDFSSSLINGRGLGAFEYLVFYEGNDNACSAHAAINATGSWAALDATELARRKAAYAAAVAREVAARAAELAAAWAPDAGNFHRELAAAGAGSAVFASDQAGLNAVSDALFYLDRELKDQKLGRPLGLDECLSATCPELVESRWAGISASHVRANLLGFRRIFSGCSGAGAGLGFDDWLNAVGAGELAGRMSSALSNAITAVESMDAPLEQMLMTDPARVMGVYSAVKDLNDPLKAEMTTVLDLELPMGLEGDND